MPFSPTSCRWRAAGRGGKKCYNVSMVRETTSDELEHLEEIAIKLGEYKIRAVHLPLNRNSVLQWIGELRDFIMETDQMDLRFFFSRADTVSLDQGSTNVAYQANIQHYVDIIDEMRGYLYKLKALNRNSRKLPLEVTVGDYRRYLDGEITFRNQEITFTGKLRSLLVTFLEDEDCSLSADKVMEVWGDENRATVPRHINKLNEKLKPLYGDSKIHIRNIGNRPPIYKLDVE